MFILKDTTLLILNIIVLTGSFIIKKLIEEAYKFIYKSLLEKGNYLELNNTKNSLIAYLPVLIKTKNKRK